MTYHSVVSADSPIHWWRLGDPGGLIAQDIGVTGGLPLFVQNFGSTPYLGMTSDGACTVKVPSGNISNTVGASPNSNQIAVTTSWSIEVWAWVFASGADQELAQLEVHPAGLVLSLRYQAAQTIIGFISGDGVAGPAGAVTPRAWHHYVLTYDHITLRVYVDGAAYANVATVQATTNNYSAITGCYQNSTSQLTGFVEDFAVYNYTLSPAQVAAHYAAADQLASVPVYLGGGTFDVTLGTSQGSAGDFTNIYGAVHKVFPTT